MSACKNKRRKLKASSARAERVTCPDCKRRVARSRKRHVLTWNGIKFDECPACGAGSPRREWNT